MTIRDSIVIERAPAEVFDRAVDLARHPEWQDAVLGVEVLGDGPIRVGTRATQVRRIGPREQELTIEVTAHEPPHRFAIRGVDGPIRPTATVTIEPVGDGSSSRLTFELELTGHGMGKALVPLARKQAEADVPESHRRFKELLESGR